jgi:hypothetical protein
MTDVAPTKKLTRSGANTHLLQTPFGYPPASKLSANQLSGNWRDPGSCLEIRELVWSRRDPALLATRLTPSRAVEGEKARKKKNGCASLRCPMLIGTPTKGLSPRVNNPFGFSHPARKGR